MKCIFCGGLIEEKVLTFTYEEDDKYLFIESVPALVCNKYGERVYSPDVTDKLLKFAKDEFRPVRTMVKGLNEKSLSCCKHL